MKPMDMRIGKPFSLRLFQEYPVALEYVLNLKAQN